MISEKTRASLPIRDYVIGIAVIVGQAVALTLYLEKRMASSEEATRTLMARVIALETANNNTIGKFERISESIQKIEVGVARIEERTRKP